MSFANVRVNDYPPSASSERNRLPAVSDSAIGVVRVGRQLSQSDFLACVDGCVQTLVQTLGALPADPQAIAAAPSNLQALFAGQTCALVDGTPIDFALFDAAILSVEERLPQTAAAAQQRLLRASRLLAESIYARSTTEVCQAR